MLIASILSTTMQVFVAILVAACVAATVADFVNDILTSTKEQQLERKKKELEMTRIDKVNRELKNKKEQNS